LKKGTEITFAKPDEFAKRCTDWTPYEEAFEIARGARPEQFRLNLEVVPLQGNWTAYELAGIKDVFLVKEPLP
jgi:hypothetical protein